MTLGPPTLAAAAAAAVAYCRRWHPVNSRWRGCSTLLPELVPRLFNKIMLYTPQSHVVTLTPTIIWTCFYWRRIAWPILRQHTFNRTLLIVCWLYVFNRTFRFLFKSQPGQRRSGFPLSTRHYRATLCVSAIFAVGRCLSVRPSVTLMYCIQTAETSFSSR